MVKGFANATASGEPIHSYVGEFVAELFIQGAGEAIIEATFYGVEVAADVAAEVAPEVAEAVAGVIFEIIAGLFG